MKQAKRLRQVEIRKIKSVDLQQRSVMKTVKFIMVVSFTDDFTSKVGILKIKI